MITKDIVLLLFSIVCVFGRFVTIRNNIEEVEQESVIQYTTCQTIGKKEIQADSIGVKQSTAGTLAIIADGIGKENTGRVCTEIVIETMIQAYESYYTLQNPEYFFRSTFLEASKRIQRTIGERKGGASVLVLFINDNTLYYGLAGNIQLAFFRNDELIPISKGQTVKVLAEHAYQEGNLSKKELIWSMEETRLWNYVGMDGFRQIEFCEIPIQLKKGDTILAMTKGIYETLSWQEIENQIREQRKLQILADSIVMEAEKKETDEQENGSVLLLKVEGLDEKD